MKRAAIPVLILSVWISTAATCPASTLRGLPGVSGGHGVNVEAVTNEHAAFSVRVDVDHANRVYRGGEVMQVVVTSEKSGYLYLFYKTADGRLKCLFPNRYQASNRISGGRRVVVPAPGAAFRLRIAPPYGKEVLKAVVTLKPIEPGNLGVKSLSAADVTPLNPYIVKDVLVELKRRPSGWAEHAVEITTVSGTRPALLPSNTVRRHPRRVILIVGISQYKDPRIRPLVVCDNDARQMARVMSRYGQMDEMIVLIDRQATLAAIRRAICTTLVERTQPGDEVFIYWSGHGGKCADLNGDEPDSEDEVLVPYDARFGDTSTMLLDDTFGRWIQCLDGRKVALIFDTCYAAGLATGVKGYGRPSTSFDFLDNELARAKDIGQQGVVMICAAQSSQIAFERREKDYSVMTYYLLGHMQQSNGPVTLSGAFRCLEVKVPAYINARFPGTAQTPVMVSHLSREVYLRP